MTQAALTLTGAEYEEIRKHQAVLLHEHEDADGKRTATLEGWGTLDEMTAEANSFHLHAVPTGVTCIGRVAVTVSDLLRGGA